MKNILIFSLFASLFSFSTLAADGSSGCGPGWFVLKKNSLVSSAIRGTTNGFLAPVVTLGMTLGTSKCSKHSIVKTESKTIHFVTNNYYELQSEISKGNGVFLSGLAETIGCNANTQSVFNSKLKEKYNEMFNTNESNAQEVLIKIYQTILTNDELTRSCSLS